MIIAAERTQGQVLPMKDKTVSGNWIDGKPFTMLP